MYFFYKKLDFSNRVDGGMEGYSELNSEELMELVRQNNERAFTEIYERYKGVLFVHAYRMLKNGEEAKDIVQDLFATLWSRRSELELTGTLSAYLYRSVRNRILDHWAKDKNHHRYLESLAGFIAGGTCVTDHLVRENELSLLIEKEVAQLPVKMRQIFEMSRSSHLSHKEIATEMNLSDKTVKKQISNALMILRKKLDVAFLLLMTLLN